MSSFEKFNTDFSRLSFDLPQPFDDTKNERHRKESKRPDMAPRSRSRNKQCIPSDDEEEVDDDDEEEEEDGDDQDSYNEIKVPRGGQKLAISTPSAIKKPIRKSRPLPSDDEDSENGEQGEYHTCFAGENKLHPNGNHAYQKHANPMHYHGNGLHQENNNDDDDDDRALVANPNAGPILTLVEGSHLQHLYHKQQQHQAQLDRFQYLQQQQSSQQHFYYQHQQHSKSRGNVSMSGMDLLKQLEQEKADSKRVKPKLDTSKVKIKGLLGNLPEPGSHNISFQQIQQQQQQLHHNRKKQQYLDPTTLEKPRSLSPNRLNSHRISNSNIPSHNSLKQPGQSTKALEHPHPHSTVPSSAKIDVGWSMAVCGCESGLVALFDDGAVVQIAAIESRRLLIVELSNPMRRNHRIDMSLFESFRLADFLKVVRSRMLVEGYWVLELVQQRL
ncbi:hypothetical protein [Parasitella parasitica]|uniref:Uncharacterized protein n=1 Tax=Parasitella parasitica TaxID=35722 RepID=A0A0B7N3H7_9FUNG|nr:hypothetical protein [Parasitella parasitica]